MLKPPGIKWALTSQKSCSLQGGFLTGPSYCEIFHHILFLKSLLPFLNPATLEHLLHLSFNPATFCLFVFIFFLFSFVLDSACHGEEEKERILLYNDHSTWSPRVSYSQIIKFIAYNHTTVLFIPSSLYPLWGWEENRRLITLNGTTEQRGWRRAIAASLPISLSTYHRDGSLLLSAFLGEYEDRERESAGLLMNFNLWGRWQLLLTNK